MLVISSSCSRRLMNSVSLMAKESGFSVIGMFQKPFGADHVQVLASQLRSLRAYERKGAPGIKERPIFAKAHLIQALEEKTRSEEHTSELQSPCNLVCRLLLE